MFDIGFSELMIIAIVALIVIGPERLPKVARTLGHLFGRMQRYVNDVKADISREMQLEELKKLQASMQDAARSFEDSVRREVNSTEAELQKIAQEANPAPLLRDEKQPVAGSEQTSSELPALVQQQTSSELPALVQQSPTPTVESQAAAPAHAGQPSASDGNGGLPTSAPSHGRGHWGASHQCHPEADPTVPG